MLSVIRVHLPSEIPILGCELTPYVLVRRSDGSISSSDIPETAPAGGYYLNYRWFRIQNDNQAAVCSVHPAELATLQCLGCLKAKVPINKSYHCSSKCFADSWRYHRALHSRSVNPVQENGTEEEELFGCFSSTGSSIADTSKFAGNFASKMGLSNGSVISGVAPVSERSGGDETWYEVGCCRTYTPTSDDVGHVLKLECTAVEASTGKVAGPASILVTARVIPAPSPTPRRMIPVNTLDGLASMEFEGRSTSAGTFSVLSYNILADLYATNEMYSYCPPWALSWAYRRQNLLREILGYGADILCLQEVQSDHFDEVFAPELEKHGYMAVYKKKTAELYVGSAYAIDGCATFFRKDRFSLVKKYEVEFNKAAQSLTEAVVPASQRKAALSRLLKDNVALIAVLEAKTTVRGSDGPSVAGKRQLICVANTHIHANPELKDVKLWQVHTLLKGLEKIAASADIPMLVCGDFNSIPGSAPHSLLASGRVDPSHPDLSTDPLGILRPASKLSHQLPLVSAYSGLSTIPGLNPGLDCQRRSLDPTSNEPLFTNCSRDFLGTLDYIFFTADSLTVESLLELLDEESLRKDTALPSPEWSSDHIALLAEFRCNPRLRR